MPIRIGKVEAPGSGVCQFQRVLGQPLGCAKTVLLFDGLADIDNNAEHLDRISLVISPNDAAVPQPDQLAVYCPLEGIGAAVNHLRISQGLLEKFNRINTLGVHQLHPGRPFGIRQVGGIGWSPI